LIKNNDLEGVESEHEYRMVRLSINFDEIRIICLKQLINMNDVAKNVQYDVVPVLLEGSNDKKVLKHALYKRSAEKNHTKNYSIPDIGDFGTSISFLVDLK
jgi:hypothetical protein